MQQTPTFHLSQWDPADLIRREDFNSDNLKIENALQAMHSGELIKTCTRLPNGIDPEISHGRATLDLADVDWDQWELVYAINRYADDSDRIYNAYTYPFQPDHGQDHQTLFRGSLEPCVIIFFPMHNRENLLSALYLGSKCVLSTAKTPYKDIQHFYFQSATSDSTFFATETHSWEIRGIR